jgi:hypothetical protein
VHPRSSIKLVADRAKEKPGTRQDRQNADNSVTETTLLPSEPPLIENVIPLDAGNAPGQSWVRAVEKFRRYEADLHERVEKTKTTNPNPLAASPLSSLLAAKRTFDRPDMIEREYNRSSILDRAQVGCPCGRV